MSVWGTSYSEQFCFRPEEKPRPKMNGTLTARVQEFKYCGVSFDGWKEMFCQFWEAKARYDQFFRADGKKKKWWTGDVSAVNQASRHQAVATVNQPLKVMWIFMQPLSCEYFRKVFKDYKDIIVRCQL